MKNFYFLFLSLFFSILSFGQDLVITGVFDGPLSGGTPKVIELYALNNIADLSTYGIGSANNGGGTDGVELTFSGNATAGDFIYITYEGSNPGSFNSYFGITPDYSDAMASINGDDAIELFYDSTGLFTGSETVIDTFGDINVDGTGQSWEYLDGWAYRKSGTTADGTSFSSSNWTYSGPNTVDGCSTNNTCTSEFPIGTYSTVANTDPLIEVGGSVNSFFYYENNGPSNEETFTVNGSNLLANIVITAPTNFEISLESGVNFTNSINLSPSIGTVDPTTIYVRMVSGLTTNNYSGDISLTSTDASEVTVSLSGYVAPDDPIIFINGSISDLAYSLGNGPSDEDMFSVEGLFLTEDITVTAPTDFEVSLTSGSNFSSSVMVSQTGGTAAETDIYIRMVSGLSENTYSGNVTASSTGATDKTISVSGTVNPTAVCANEGDVIFTEIMQNPSVNSDPNGEYFELYNTTNSSIDIKGWVIKDDASASESHVISTTLVIPANGYIVIGNGATPNGGTPMDYSYDNDISLGNANDGIVLECSGNIIDSVIWDDGDTFPDPSGASMELSTTAMNSTDNNNGANWGDATSAFGSGDLGTPGSANDFTLSSKKFEIEGFKIFPNPNTLGYVNILAKNTSNINVAVFDMLGKQIIKQSINNNTLDVSKLNTGIYTIKATQDDATSTQKLVIK